MRFFVLFFVVVIRSSLLFKNQKHKKVLNLTCNTQRRTEKKSSQNCNAIIQCPWLPTTIIIVILLLSYHFTTFCMYAFCSLLCTNLARSTIWWNRSCWVVNTQVHIWSALCVLRTVLFTHWGECTFNQCLCRT